ncbi:YheC/YheD family protein [Metabacillus sp. cB07]|uniref:YheC/YheD family endospore coat-associated protein n=1 Tax=Metabacillus sp. cB07 TaxID=2806989 RepID=UPI001939BBDC|nr:YheC/YheD family protein [Metabacillus sp. cB07]
MTARRPLVGILAGDGIDGAVFHGDGAYFKSLQHEVQKAGEICCVVTLSAIHELGVSGFVYSRRHQQWAKVELPLPHVIYNRLPDRSAEETTGYRLFMARMKAEKIPVFNPFFFNKWDVYCLLKQKLNSSLPLTYKITAFDDILTFMNNYPSAYLKPVDSSHGQGIFRIRKESSGFKLTSADGSDTCYKDFWSACHPFLKGYLIQEEAHTDTVLGRKYDLRALVHLSRGEYKITGIGVRASGGPSHPTTHVKYGGTLLPFESVREKADLNHLQAILSTAGNELSRSFGLIGEFSADIGLTEKGPVIYELNSKPMSFDEAAIQKKRLDQLLSLFFELSKGTAFQSPRLPLR